MTDASAQDAPSHGCTVRVPVPKSQLDRPVTRPSSPRSWTRSGPGRFRPTTLKPCHHSWRPPKDALKAIPEVHRIALMGANFDVILLVRTVDNVDLRRVIFDQIQSMPVTLDTQTFLVFEDMDTR